MPVPTSYTETEFAAFLHGQNSSLAADLGYAATAESYAEVIADTLLSYGISDIADATDIRKLRALGRVEFWHAMVRGLVPRYNFGVDGASYDRRQQLENAQRQLALASVDATAYLPAMTIELYSIENPGDPYDYRPE